MNCEYGVPLWAAEIIAALKMYNDITLNIVLPYEEQSVKWVKEFHDCYFSVHLKADEGVIANTHYHPDCYYEADQMMIEESDLLVVCGKKGDLPDSVQYAESLEVEIQYSPIL